MVNRSGVKYTKMRSLLVIIILLVSTSCVSIQLRAQQDSLTATGGPVPQKDVIDVIRAILKKPVGENRGKKAISISLLPVLGYNPSFGFNFGVNVMAGVKFGSQPNTIYSVFNVSATYSTKGIATLRARHNMFTPGNKWNWQGDWQLSKMGVVDYGLGTRANKSTKQGFTLSEWPTHNGDSAFPIKYNYIQLFEKAYRRIGEHTYIGAGVDFDIFSDINDKRFADTFPTPHHRYSRRNNFDDKDYAGNGFLLGFQYNNREHPVRSYGGFYADVTLRVNQTWMGSSQNALLLLYDLRQYFSLSKRHPEHVLAFWEWASYDLSGKIPYLNLPGTAHDMYQRSGRGYTFGRFKGPSYAYFEGEYRFPIMDNGLIAGVCFINVQTASNDDDQNVFKYWAPAAGVGARILFDKTSRSALCLDYARGRNGASGFFAGLNEVF